MHNRIDIFSSTNKNINFISRTKTYGEEFNMVDRYVNYIVEHNRKIKTHMAIFVEPQLDFGYPDLVVVEYTDFKRDIWIPERNNLDDKDIKILFEVNRLNLSNINDIVFLLGHTKREVLQSLKKLEKAALLSITGEKIHKILLSKYCSIKKIISIEAKIDKWKDAINQAQNSYLFATEVYVLLNKLKCTNSIIERCKNEGTGIILVNGKIKKVVQARKNNFPASYMSLFFNELIQCYIHGGINNNEYYQGIERAI